MKKILLVACAALALTACNAPTESADQRQAQATKTSLNALDREVGMPRIVNGAQRKLLKNAYEDMDQTTLTYVYSQGMDGKFVCLGQAVGYGVPYGTQFTSPTTVEWIHSNLREKPQAEPNGLFMPDTASATIVNLIDPTTGVARTALMEPNMVTSPNKLHSGAVSVQCPGDVDPKAVKDVKETSAIAQRD